ncbi:MAG: hypothetical protein KC635_04015, partial [Myxococcales bacterium]|nr:hypothetical protein [Myxococcales bacterium]
MIPILAGSSQGASCISSSLRRRGAATAARVFCAETCYDPRRSAPRADEEPVTERAVYFANPLRTPIGRLGGALSSVRPDDLLSLVFGEVIARAGVDPAAIDEVVAGCANQAGEDN